MAEPQPETIDLQCAGLGGAVPSFEGAESGRCWHHMGHHVYFLPEARLLQRVNGSVFTVEQLFTPPPGGPGIVLGVSLDGKAWTTAANLTYTPNDEDRTRVAIDVTVADLPFRFFRVHTPATENEGLSGYLDHSAFTLTVAVPPSPIAEPEPLARSDCQDGILESFFDDHPCWFGGYDEADEATASPGPELAHASPPVVGESYYESPSFVHTHYLGVTPGGVFRADLDLRLWRTSQEVTCAADEAGVLRPTAILVLAQGSSNGTIWSDLARTYQFTPGPLSLDVGVPEGTRFVRFSTGQGSGTPEGACYHANTFLTSSRLALTDG